MAKRRQKLKQMEPKPKFMTGPIEDLKPHWELTIADHMSDDHPVFRATGSYTMMEAIKAAARECPESNGIVVVRRFEKGYPTTHRVFRCHYVWGHWRIVQIRSRMATVPRKESEPC